MNSAHTSLLQLVDGSDYALVVFKDQLCRRWYAEIYKDPLGMDLLHAGKGPSYEAACYDLLQQLKR